MTGQTYDAGMSDELWHRDAWELAERIRAGELSARTLLEVSLARIDRLDPKLNAVWFVDRDRAVGDAELVDRRVEAGEDP
jgi:Asp-tRNA(Asn)/Glu-tRNA(Gln) amidotransferase A subunit family amidase